MFESHPNPFTIGFHPPSYSTHARLLNTAIALFNRSRTKGMLAQLKSLIFRRSNALLDLAIVPAKQVRNQCYGGIKPVRITQICGSLGRVGDFDKNFRPLTDRIQDRWIAIAIIRAQDFPLAPVNLIQVGDCYFVVDGHHRISVACARGESVIDAEVVIWETNGVLPWAQQTPSFAFPQVARQFTWTSES